MAKEILDRVRRTVGAGAVLFSSTFGTDAAVTNRSVEDAGGLAGRPALVGGTGVEQTGIVPTNESLIDMPRFSITGAPERVDQGEVLQASVLLDAEGPMFFDLKFVNTIGEGSQMILAEPGAALVGPDFPQEIIDASGGAIDRFSPANQKRLSNRIAETVSVPEGGFVVVSGGVMKIEVDGVTIELAGKRGHNWLVYIRGKFADGKQDSDLNVDAIFSKYVPDHILATRLPSGAFASEEQFKQFAETSHTGGTNCGNEGCSELSVLFYDTNTKAWVVQHEVQLNAGFQYVASNGVGG